MSWEFWHDGYRIKGGCQPSAIFLSRYDKPIAGSVVMVSREGTRPLLVEVQALVDDSQGSTQTHGTWA